MGRILVVEDTELVRRVIQAYLEKLGQAADFASNGWEALELFQRGGYDLVLLDSQLPGIDGIEVLRLIRQRSCRRIPVIVMSASPVEARRCIEAGMDDFLLKPFSSEQLAGILARWLPGEERRGDVASSSRPQLDDVGMREAALIALREYERSAEKRLESLAVAVESGNFGEARRLAHAFRPLCAYLGAGRMVEILRRIEEASRGGDAARLPGLLEELRQEHEKVQEQLPGIEKRLNSKQSDSTLANDRGL